jgi:preprotein translocase subunit SecA
MQHHTSASLLRLLPGDLALGRPYAEREEREPPWYDDFTLTLWHGVLWPALRPLRAEGRRQRAFVARVDGFAQAVAALDDDGLRARARALRQALRAGGLAQTPVAECFALVREAAGRIIGKRHYPTQLGAGWLLLQGTLVEMATGEGKTFAATLPAVTAALAGLPVHVITVNDYLAERDAQTMGPLYEFFGLRCTSIVHDMTRGQRREAYAGHVTYVSNKELAFDYLRDRAALGDHASPLHLAVQSLRRQKALSDADPVLRGLVFGIIDEADSVFVDEARTPLILSRTVEGDTQQKDCDHALALARQLQPDVHYLLEAARRRTRLTDLGRDEITRLCEADESAEGSAEESADEPGLSVRQLEENVQSALSALLLYTLDEHYVVMEDKVQIVDASTGRIMPDRAWEQGLHQMIEAKEGVPLTGRRETLARITYQRLFRRYLRLAGMTGTATEVAAEIGSTYGLPVTHVPLHKPSRRRQQGLRCLATAADKWQAVVDAVQAVAVQAGRPVLIGTRTVSASEQISAALQARGIDHVVLNARQDSDEAHLVERAGEAGRVTVATNMAGRGTDILLAAGMAERGGLHVILTEYNESRRVDRQLIGRCARQGDPGSFETLLALDDEIFVTHTPRLVRWLGPLATQRGGVAMAAVAWLRWMAQGEAERLNREARDNSLKQDRRLSQVLAFSGRGE